MVKEIYSQISGLLHPYKEGFLVDDSLSDNQTLILALHLLEEQKSKKDITYEELKSCFLNFGRKEDSFRKVLHNLKKQQYITENNKNISFLIKGLKEVWKVLKKSEKSTVYVIKSGEHFSAIKLLEEFFMTEIQDEVLLIFDSHISPETLYPFSVLSGRIKKIKILTSNIYDEEKFNNYCSKLSKETGIEVEVKKNFKTHDRWIINGKKCWSMGCSLKDMGNKDSTINELFGILDSLKELFETRWLEK